MEFTEVIKTDIHAKSLVMKNRYGFVYLECINIAAVFE